MRRGKRGKEKRNMVRWREEKKKKKGKGYRDTFDRTEGRERKLGGEV